MYGLVYELKDPIVGIRTYQDIIFVREDDARQRLISVPEFEELLGKSDPDVDLFTVTFPLRFQLYRASTS